MSPSAVMLLTGLQPMYQDLDVASCNTFGTESLANLPVSLLRLRLNGCFSLLPNSLAHLGRLTALEHLDLCAMPDATNDEGMEHLAPQLHSRLSALHFTGFSTDQVLKHDKKLRSTAT